MKDKRPAHTGMTDKGNIRDVKVERVGKVTILRRGNTYYLYYRQNKRTERPKIEGNLTVARATAAKVAAALAEERPSPLGFERTSPQDMATAFLDYIENVKGLAWRTVDRYRAALDRFLDYCPEANIKTVDAFSESNVENFVRWLRGQTRVRNGAEKGTREHYKVGGIRFILCTCRTAYNWAGRKKRMLPPYAENPFRAFPIEQLRDDGADEELHVFTAAQEKAFWGACSPWQRQVFLPLATYGMRVGELTHLLIENVDFEESSISICSKPEMYWHVKTRRRRKVPLTVSMRALLKKLIGERKAGFVFLNEPFHRGERTPVMTFATDKAFRAHLTELIGKLLADTPEATKPQQRKAVVHFCRQMGQIPTKRLQAEFSAITAKIGCPEFTRVHDLRHLFTTRAQEAGANPLVVQQIIGHTTLEMTNRYSHFGPESKKQVVDQAAPNVDSGDTTKVPAP